MTDIVERLHARGGYAQYWHETAAEATAEIARLRTALKEAMAECSGYTLSNDVANRVWDIARRALEPKP